ncbi:BGTF surface domain-containing protein [Halobacterium sp. CBA1126]|nr:BGTF surface domain-containing protein [Halobacterium sp. CBA1126]MUV59478.1 cell surface protein [Halobacterium sp. CBA1126]
MRALSPRTILCPLLVVIVLTAAVCTPVVGAATATAESASLSHDPATTSGSSVSPVMDAPPRSTQSAAGNSSSDGWSQTRYEQPAGDIVTVSLNLSATTTTDGDTAERAPARDHAYIQIGDVSAGFIDVLRVEDTDDDGAVTFSINTRTLGTSDSISATDSDLVYHSEGDVVRSSVHGRLSATDDGPTFFGPDGSELSGFDDYLATLGLIDSAAADRGIDQLRRPLQPGDYPLLASTEGEFCANVTPPAGRSSSSSATYTSESTSSTIGTTTIELTKPGLDGLSIQAAPAGPANAAPNQTALSASATESRSVTSTDRIVITAEATGIYGHLVAIEGGFEGLSTGFGPGTLSQLETRTGEGVEFAVESTDGPVLRGPGPSEGLESPLEVLDLSSLDATAVAVYANNTAGKLYIVIDPRATDAFTLTDNASRNFSASLGYHSNSTQPFLFDREDRNIQSYYRGLVGGAGGDVNTPAFPYFEPGEKATATAQFSLVEPHIQFKSTGGWVESDAPVVVDRTSPTRIQGKTNVAPGTEAILQVTSQSENSSFTSLQQSTVSIAPNGTFSGTFSLPTTAIGETSTLSVLIRGTEIAHTELVTVAPEAQQTTSQSTQATVASAESQTATGESGGATPGLTPLVALLAVAAAFAWLFIFRR